MPIPPRTDKPWMIHHAMMRSLPEIPLFRDDLDRAKFMDLLREAVARYRLDLLAFALMHNHIHLLIRRSSIPLSRAIQFINGSYARTFNRRYQRRGHVFDRVFKSKPVPELIYQGVATVYIARNPIIVGMRPEELARSPWNSHGDLKSAREQMRVSDRFARATAPPQPARREQRPRKSSSG